jgi:hypothetical protein
MLIKTDKRYSFFSSSETNGVITYHRRQIEGDHFPRWHKSEALIKKLFVTRTGTIEDDGKYMLQVDFANKLADK